jgi:hypothetical protein
MTSKGVDYLKQIAAEAADDAKTAEQTKQIAFATFTTAACIASQGIHAVNDTPARMVVGLSAIDGPLCVLAPMTSDKWEENKREVERSGPGAVDATKMCTEDALVFTALLAAYSSELMKSRLDGRPNPLELAHAAFVKIHGRPYADRFLRTCDCENCDARRKTLGVQKGPRA